MSAYRIPQLQTNVEGEERRVGFELEFSGLEMLQVASILADSLDGKVVPATHAECSVEVPDVGEFIVELDWRFAKETAKERAEHHMAASGTSVPDDPFMEWMTRIASQVVPVEVVCPPIPVSHLQILDKPVAMLRDAGALGTEKSLIYAFGVHINPDLPDLTAKTLIRYIKAYSVCQAWLLKAHQVDPVRRITPYIDLYPAQYINVVMDYKNESMKEVMDDYLRFNPTRNRALDLTPLFKHIDADRLEAKLQDPRIKGRPTFHYRMPNCEIEKSGWSLATAWHYWGVIEHLVSNPEKLDGLCAQWNKRQQKIITIQEESWHSELDGISASLVLE